MGKRYSVHTSPTLKSAIRPAVRATLRTRRRKSTKAVTGDVVVKLLATCTSSSLIDARDEAVPMVGLASGARRRRKIASLRREQLTFEPPIVAEDGPPLTWYPIHLGRTKTPGSNPDKSYISPGGEWRRRMVA